MSCVNSRTLFSVMLVPEGGMRIRFFSPGISSVCSLQLMLDGLENIAVTGGLSEPYSMTLIPSTNPPPTMLNSTSLSVRLNIFGKIRFTAILSPKSFPPI